MNKLIEICSKFFNDKNLTDELYNICSKYKNITKSEMKQINLKIYTKNNFLNFNKYYSRAIDRCCENNNLLIIKYFVKRCGITKNEIMIDNCLGFACLYKHLPLIKYLTNTYNLMKNNFMKTDKHNNNCWHYIFLYNGADKLCYKINLYMCNKYNFTKNDILVKNKWNEDLLSLCCLYGYYKSLKFLVIKYKFTESNLKYLNFFKNYIKIKKILSINNLLNSKYNYNKLFDLIYKKN